MGWRYILGEEDRLTDPRDLGFDASGNLWIANRDDDRTFIVFEPGTDRQVYERRKDAAANHFMEETAALSFDTCVQFGSCGETRNTYDDTAPPNDFTGPVLWSTDLDIFAAQNPYGLGSHLDMLHQSPKCVGIAWERDNVYWAFDGKDDAIVCYDFALDHCVGRDDHADGVVHRLTEFEVAHAVGVPGPSRNMPNGSACTGACWWRGWTSPAGSRSIRSTSTWPSTEPVSSTRSPRAESS